MRFFESQIRQRRDKSYDEERFWPRFKCNLPSEFSDDTGNKRGCRIVDMSESGIAIVTDVKLKRGNSVSIEYPPIKGEVVWVRNNKAGLRLFD